MPSLRDTCPSKMDDFFQKLQRGQGAGVISDLKNSIANFLLVHLELCSRISGKIAIYFPIKGAGTNAVWRFSKNHAFGGEGAGVLYSFGVLWGQDLTPRASSFSHTECISPHYFAEKKFKKFVITEYYIVEYLLGAVHK